jgi:hypothetical protein
MTGTPSGAAFEVARDSDLGVGVGVKDLVVEPLQSLRHPFRRGYVGALGSGVGGRDNKVWTGRRSNRRR